MRVVIAGGGTAGHVNPALAVARQMSGDDIFFVGTRLGAEATLVPAAGFELESLDVRGFDRSRPASIFPTGARAARSVARARRILARRRPDVVLGMGGYVSLPVSAAAAAMRIPLALHEQNIVFGLANRVCKPLARRVAVSFEETLASAGRKGVYTGNPVLPEIIEADLEMERGDTLQRFALDPTRATLLVFGGSQGATTINKAAVGLARLWTERTDVQVLHITGRAQHEWARAEVNGTGSNGLLYRAVPFVERMAGAYAAADIALCRGGATTVAELTALGVPAIVVPYPHHRDRQQERHGAVLERAGAAVVVSDGDATPDRIASVASTLMGDRDRLASMRAAAGTLGRPDAAAAVAKVLREVSA